MKVCSLCGFQILDEEEHMKTCHAYKSAKYFLHETIGLIVMMGVLLFFIVRIIS